MIPSQLSDTVTMIATGLAYVCPRVCVLVLQSTCLCMHPDVFGNGVQAGANLCFRLDVTQAQGSLSPAVVRPDACQALALYAATRCQSNNAEADHE